MYEYKIKQFGAKDDIETYLNVMGKKGWRAVQITPASQFIGVTVYFERQTARVSIPS